MQKRRNCEQFVKVYTEFIAKNNLVERAIGLETKYTQPLTAAQSEQLTAMDKIRHEGMVLTERKCRQLNFGLIEWSPKLQEALLTHRLWDKLFKRKTGRRVGWRCIIKLAKEVNMIDKVHSSLAEIIENKDLVWIAYHKTKWHRWHNQKWKLDWNLLLQA